MNSLSGIAFTAFGEQVKWADMIGNLLGLIALALGWRRSVWTWPLQLAAGAVLIAAYLGGHVPGLIGKQLIVIVTAVWGWAQWRRGRRDSGEIAVRFASARERAVLVAGAALGTAAVAGLFLAVPSLSWSPWLDAYIFVGTLVAMVAQARGWVEFWLAWIAVDLVGVPFSYTHGYVFSALTFTIYFVLVLLGLAGWWMKARTHTVPKGVTA
ncbi:nicotinamide mononucleotide transporter family protein [Kitasatospora paracochleata]|uniref:Nicotinamide mononucleotide transporter n=1 Tax=Kitasatospora paracochleata TaxID=58354 RepID=A0ABT1IV44_9ACTN|nr:nicotinamide mononucleotide transporter [Kitasatospora paracochleata]